MNITYQRKYRQHLGPLWLGLLAWTLTTTGCWSTGSAEPRRRPLLTPHFVTSNGLGESSPLPSPRAAINYDLLMATVRGDFGLKSSVVEAAGREPEYRGADTLVVPLYIPVGAQRIRLGRTPRSEGSGGATILRLPRLPINKRSRLGSSRGKVIPKRPLQRTAVTMPSIFLPRSYGRRIAPRITRRIDVAADSEPSASVSNINEFTSVVKPVTESIKYTSTTEMPTNLPSNIIDAVNETLAVTTKRTTTNVTKTIQFSSTEPSASSPKNKLNHKIKASTELLGIKESRKISKMRSRLKTPRRSPTHRVLSKRRIEMQPTGNITYMNKNNSVTSKETLKRPVVPSHSALKTFLLQRKQNNATLTTRNKELNTTEVQFSKTRSENLDVFKLPETDKILRENATKPVIDTTTIKTSSPVKKRRLILPRRGPATTESTVASTGAIDEITNKSTKKPSPRRLSKIRVTALPRKSLLAISKPETSTEALKITSPKSSSQGLAKSSVTPLSVSKTIRKRRPLRPVLAPMEIPQPTADLSFISTVPTRALSKTDFLSTFADIFSKLSSSSTTTTKPTTTVVTNSQLTENESKKRKTTKPKYIKPRGTTVETAISSLAETTSSDISSTISTTAPSVREIHEFFNISNYRTENDITTKTPVITTTDLPSSQPTSNPFICPLKSTPMATIQTKHDLLPKLGLPGDKDIYIARTPAEKAIESLSEVMRHATSGTNSKDKLQEIATDIDSINKKLADQGIIIVHAEINGTNIRLKNHTKIRNGTHFISASDAVKRIKRPRLRKRVQEKISRQSMSNIDHSSLRKVNNTKGLVKPFMGWSNETKNLKGITDERQKSENLLSTTQLAQTTVPTTEIVSLSPKTNNAKSTNFSVVVKTTSTTLAPSLLEATTYFPIHLKGSDTDFRETIHIDISIDTQAKTENISITSDQNESRVPRTDEIDIIIENFKPHSGKAENSISKFKTILIIEPPIHRKHSNLTYKTFVKEAPSVQGVSEEAATEKEETSALYAISLLGIFPIAGVVAHLIRRYLRGDSMSQKALADSEERPDGFGHPHHFTHRPQTLLPPLPGSKAHPFDIGYNVLPMAVQRKWEISRSQLRFSTILGEGNFGIVWKAEARGLTDANGEAVTAVAVKRVKDGAGQRERSDLTRETHVMRMLGTHPHVVALLGCCTETEPNLVVMEYVVDGKLQTFLRDHRTRGAYCNVSFDVHVLTARDLTRFARDVADGCEFLSSCGVIHRDLAARNILVDANKVCKISDFGLARCIQDIGSDIYERKSKGALPIRWMAPESLNMNIFTQKSDVWSFGILCWEIVTLGATPYPGLNAREVLRQVTEGYRLERPDHCRPQLHRLIADCWLEDYNLRPSFHRLQLDFSTLMDHNATFIDLDHFPEEDYFSMNQNNDEKL